MPDNLPPAPLWRRLAAALYDSLLLLAVWMLLLLADVVVREQLNLPRDFHLLRALLFLSGLGFCGWFWVHGGQTLGMRVWRLRLRRTDLLPLRWPMASLRYAVAYLSWGLGGLGMLWCLVDRRRRSWHDLAAGTEVVLLPKTLSAPSAGDTAPTR